MHDLFLRAAACLLAVITVGVMAASSAQERPFDSSYGLAQDRPFDSSYGLAQDRPAGSRLEPIPDKLVVLTFDDSKASHYTVVRPLLKKYGFGATFFITEGFMFPTNKKDYLTWDQIAELHRDGFEIGNHTRDHKGVSKLNLAGLREQIEAINAQCAAHGIPAPVSFAYPGNAIDPSAFPVLEELGFRFARRGGAPECPYEEGSGVAYEPGRDHPLLLPSAGDARPAWTLEKLKRSVSQAKNGRIAILQFHGAPDVEHPWVNTPRERFEEYMKYLHDEGFKAIAVRDLARYVDWRQKPDNAWKIIEERKGELANQRAVCSAL
jgi:peptidoglycan/xylan/chitin deacetylase (PgdA/CDA1 family)